MVLFIGGGQIIIDLGRPDRMLNVLQFGRYQSPLLWDATSISAYLTASTVYLYLPMIPDIAILRDHCKKSELPLPRAGARLDRQRPPAPGPQPRDRDHDGVW